MQKPVEKAADLPRKGAIITLHPYLPSRKEQINPAMDWGIEEIMFEQWNVSPIWEDDVRKVRTTYWPSRLPSRQKLLNAYGHWKCPEHVIFFANPLCVGFSQAHAQSVIDTLFNAEVAMYVHDLGKEYRAGADLADFWEAFRRKLKAAQMKQYRKNSR